MQAHPFRCVAVFDLDGTLSNDTIRSIDGPWLHTTAHPEERNERWDAYYAAAVNDPPIFPVFDIAEALRRLGFTIVLATGRPERYRGDTMKWLRDWSFGTFEQLVMRPEGNRKRNADLKAEHAVAIGPERIALWVDDHPEVPEALRPHGIHVLSLHNPVWEHPEDTDGAAR